MSQRIGFCTTADGIKLAYAVIGTGRPIVYVPGWPTHLEVEWEQPFVRHFLESLSLGHTLIRYDMRGSGLSDRPTGGLTFDDLVNDLEAIVERLDLERFALLSMGDLAGPLAIAYAAKQPQRITHLVLQAPFLKGAELAPIEHQRAMISYTASFGFPIFDFTNSSRLNLEQQRVIREIDDAAADASVQAEVLRLAYEVDVSELAPQVRASALVMHGRKNPFIPFTLGRATCATLPNATFFPFEGDSASPLAYAQDLIPEIRAFLQGGDSSVRSGPRLGNLSFRESQILQMLAAGYSNQQIAEHLALSVRTIERHISNLYAKLNVRSRAQATAAYRDLCASSVN